MYWLITVFMDNVINDLNPGRWSSITHTCFERFINNYNVSLNMFIHKLAIIKYNLIEMTNYCIAVYNFIACIVSILQASFTYMYIHQTDVF